MSTYTGNLKDGSQNILHPGTVASKVAMDDVSGNPSTVETEVSAVRSDVAALKGINTVNIKGTIDGTTKLLPTTDYKVGDEYIVAAAGTYAGNVCELNDVLICVKDYAAATASNDDWIVGQVNIDTTYLKKLSEDGSGNPTYNGNRIDLMGIPVVENGAPAPSNLAPGGVYFEKDAVAQAGNGE